METFEAVTAAIAITLGVGWASGINLYAAMLTLGLMQRLGYATLPAGLEILADPLVIAAAALMYMVEFVADKTPGVDTGWDAIHTFVRLPAGALLAAAAVGDVAPAAELAAAIVGGGMAAGSHSVKAGGRALINTSPEPFSNWTASIAEDVAVIGGLWLALYSPLVFLVLLALFIAVMIWLLPKILRGLRALGQRVGRLLGRHSRSGDAGVGRLPHDGP
ncbi:DUF4126 domain-containing protein [Halofilum ochraceum]|uniref:DUF4126 domain-containing protein n=1 Tax=Halofilum ochraceum TaxID=1611323 RepID=UPI0008D9A5DF|nr:DUF4126 domain-containing protein [Halofilum ochraceum]